MLQPANLVACVILALAAGAMLFAYSSKLSLCRPELTVDYMVRLQWLAFASTSVHWFCSDKSLGWTARRPIRRWIVSQACVHDQRRMRSITVVQKLRVGHIAGIRPFVDCTRASRGGTGAAVAGSAAAASCLCVGAASGPVAGW